MTEMRLLGRLYLNTDIILKTGLHIGSVSGETDLSALSNAVLRHPISGNPYIPGTNLRGKMRSLWEVSNGMPQNEFIRSLSPVVRIHSLTSTPATEALIDADPVGRIFGMSGDHDPAIPTRLTVTDFQLSSDIVEKMKRMRMVNQSEIKTEVSVDRRTTAANPRQNERVPKESVFMGGQLIYSVFSLKDLDDGLNLLQMLLQLEDSWIGGNGARGYGQLQFINLFWSARRVGEIESKAVLNETTLTEIYSSWSETHSQLHAYFTENSS